MRLLNENREDFDKFPTSKKQIIQLFKKHRELFDIYFVVNCAKCKANTKIDCENTKSMKCVGCDSVLKTTETNYFVYIPIEQQIIKSVTDNWSYISEFDTSCNKDTKSISDAHDGAILKNVLKQYSDSDVNILSLCLNLDGANKYKSNSLSVWPIQLQQNFLPPNIRFLPNNIITAGLHYHKDKPNCYSYMLPLVEELNHLSELNITINIEGKDYMFKPVITSCAVDLPAKSMLQETKQHGGYFACTYCEIPGELVVIEKLHDPDNDKKKKNKKNTENPEKNQPQKFVRYVNGDEPYKLRDEDKTLEQMLAVSTSRIDEAIDGVKDVSCLVGLEHFNIIFSIGVEYMHGCLLGASKRLLNLFCKSKYNRKSFYIRPKMRKLLNGRILAIKPTSNIVRKARSLDDRKNFKASEYRSMLIYYLPVCLPGCLPNVYVQHIRLLSAAVYTLLKTSISNEEIDCAEEMLLSFVKQHQELFGKESMVMVIHLLMHLSESVRRLGPLWCHSAFAFERNNGCLLKLVNGTTDVLHQISTKYTLSKSLSKKSEMTKATDNKIFLGIGVNIVEKCLMVLCFESSKTLDFSNVSLQVYKRIKLGKTIYTSLLYTRPKKSIDYFIGLNDETIGTAKFYFEYDGKIYVIMEEFEVIDNIYHISKVQSTKTNIMAPIDVIDKKYIFMKVGIHQYIAITPNTYENE